MTASHNSDVLRGERFETFLSEWMFKNHPVLSSQFKKLGVFAGLCSPLFLFFREQELYALAIFFRISLFLLIPAKLQSFY